MSYYNGLRGLPENIPTGTGPEPRGDPPFCQRVRDCEAGVSETATDPSIIQILLHLDGSSSIQELNAHLRVHQIELGRLWFTLPGTATLPQDRTLFLTLDNLPNSSSILTAHTRYGVDPLVVPPAKYEGDSGGQANEPMLASTLAAISLGRATPGDQVEWKNDGHFKHKFAGASRGVRELHLTLRQADGTPYTDLNVADPTDPANQNTHVFVELFIWGEWTM